LSLVSTLLTVSIGLCESGLSNAGQCQESLTSREDEAIQGETRVCAAFLVASQLQHNKKHSQQQWLGEEYSGQWFIYACEFDLVRELLASGSFKEQ
jgi:hypothetical protein